MVGQKTERPGVEIVSNNASNFSKAHETRDSLSSFYSQVVLVYLHQFGRNSLLKSGLQTQIAKNTITSYFKVQGHSMSLTLTPSKSLSLVFLMMSSMLVPICNSFSRQVKNDLIFYSVFSRQGPKRGIAPTGFWCVNNLPMVVT